MAAAAAAASATTTAVPGYRHRCPHRPRHSRCRRHRCHSPHASPFAVAAAATSAAAPAVATTIECEDRAAAPLLVAHLIVRAVDVDGEHQLPRASSCASI
eukprot:scaffold6211_cov118-Isochrysis_galbana.AAC.4